MLEVCEVVDLHHTATIANFKNSYVYILILRGPVRSLKLGDVYRLLTSKQPLTAHQAESDVNMLLECAVALEEDFTNWSNRNAKRFCDIPAMCPGKTIGS